MPLYPAADLDRWSRAVVTIVRHTGKIEHTRTGRRAHVQTVRFDGCGVGEPMSVEEILRHVHHDLSEAAFPEIALFNRRLSWTHVRDEVSGWWQLKVACQPGKY